jgi:hypothetical protein
MPNRILRDWTDSERVNALSAPAERFFVRLIMKADDYGCFHGNPVLLKSYLFPLKDIRVADVTRWIDECKKSGLIVEYEVNGKRYLAIINHGQRMRNSRRLFPEPPTSCGELPRVAASCRELPPETETETRSEKERVKPQAAVPDDGCAADAGGGHAPRFPESVDEVIELADRAGAVCTPEQAALYLAKRQATGWLDRNGRPIRHLGADVKAWLLTFDQIRKDEEKRRGGGADWKAATGTLAAPPKFAKNERGL